MKPGMVAALVAINLLSVGCWLYVRAQPADPLAELAEFELTPKEAEQYRAGIERGREIARDEMAAVLRDAKLTCECR